MKVVTYLGSVVLWGGRHCKQMLLPCVGSACSVWTTLGLFAPCQGGVCFPHLHCSVFSVLCKGTVPRASYILCTSQSKPLRFSGALQGHTPRWAVLFVPFPGLSSSGDRVLGDCTAPGRPCVSITSMVQPRGFPSAP